MFVFQSLTNTWIYGMRCSFSSCVYDFFNSGETGSLFFTDWEKGNIYSSVTDIASVEDFSVDCVLLLLCLCCYTDCVSSTRLHGYKWPPRSRKALSSGKIVCSWHIGELPVTKGMYWEEPSLWQKLLQSTNTTYPIFPLALNSLFHLLNQTFCLQWGLLISCVTIRRKILYFVDLQSSLFRKV